jgi:energy-coupling factor transporter transmembrane protein EcfT
MVRGKQPIFKYKTIPGPLHKVPAILKLLLLLPISIICVHLPPLWLSVGILTVLIAALLCGITLREQLSDLRPAVFYGIFMYVLSILSNLTGYWNNIPVSAGEPVSGMLSAIFIPGYDFSQIALRLILIVQLSALLFRTTSPLKIREAVRLNSISLFISFIPEIFKTWSDINLTWKARGGGQGLAKIKTLVFVLISISFEKAMLKAKALEARGIL